MDVYSITFLQIRVLRVEKSETVVLVTKKIYFSITLSMDD